MDKSKEFGTRGLDVGYALFSRSGFTRTAQMRAEAEGVRLYRLDELFDLDRRNDRRLSIFIGMVRERASMYSSMFKTAFSKDCHCIAGRLMKPNTPYLSKSLTVSGAAMPCFRRYSSMQQILNIVVLHLLMVPPPL